MSNLVVDDKDNILGIEYFKTLRTNIQFRLESENDNCFVITSSQPGEGKSFVSCNLASMFAIGGYKTLIVDLDLRRRTQHLKLDVENNEGMVNILMNKEYENLDYIEANIGKYIKKTKVENLDVITAGSSSITPPELLIKPRFNKVIEYLKTKYDYVILDTTPVNVVTDASIVAKDRKVVVVTSLNETKLSMLEDTVATLKKVNATLLGSVMNKLPSNKSRCSSNNKYGYEYTYSYSTALEPRSEENKIVAFGKNNSIRLLDLAVSIGTLPITLVAFIILMITSKINRMDKVFEKDIIVTKNGKTKNAYKFCTTTTELDKKSKPKKVTNGFGKLLENTKLEYLPHVFNYISGDLSLIKKYNQVNKEDVNNEKKVIQL